MRTRRYRHARRRRPREYGVAVVEDDVPNECDDRVCSECENDDDSDAPEVCPECPTCPEVPECPTCPEVPECPACPDGKGLSATAWIMLVFLVLVMLATFVGVLYIVVRIYRSA